MQLKRTPNSDGKTERNSKNRNRKLATRIWGRRWQILGPLEGDKLAGFIRCASSLAFQRAQERRKRTPYAKAIPVLLKVSRNRNCTRTRNRPGLNLKLLYLSIPWAKLAQFFCESLWLYVEGLHQFLCTFLFSFSFLFFATAAFVLCGGLFLLLLFCRP